ncbi:hypothetical protein [Streptomyces beihaiensis]|uniref:Transposase n=1 Tax=Streptomyces beihaiensis TaxID=2984495 RepID=A0ABT3TS85_9ACTN|nr:hypothetical protein [Streptomyces beihaiensis]MCX3059886.1 hypothetical protein [Streptomyces beihaiensis]
MDKPVFWSRAKKAQHTCLRLRSVDRTVGVEAALRMPSVMVLVVEDACVRFAQEDWAMRRPPRRRPLERRHWYAEGQRLRAKSARLRALAAECLDGPE